MSYSSEENKKYLSKRYYSQRNSFISELGGECRQCGSTDNLEIDHINPEDKSFNVGALWAEKDLRRVRQELEKCQLLCSSCHRLKTAKENSKRLLDKGYSHGTYYSFQNKKCACDICITFKEQYYIRRNSKRRKSLSGRLPYEKNPNHGTRNKYRKGCRCDRCRKANAEHIRAYRVRRAPVA